jgi:dTDP-4-amino-4,6-dideoxygalactose transaminase
MSLRGLEMTVPFVDLKIQYRSIKAEIDRAIQEILDSASFVGGKSVTDFESAFAKVHQARFCIGTSSGTDSLHIALWALGISRGDAVILPVNTFFATAEVVVLCGATPIFIDCDPETYNLDTRKLRAFLEDSCHMDGTGRLVTSSAHQPIMGIIPVHLYGQPADMDPILELARKYRLKVIEDACQAHLAEYASAREKTWHPVGSLGDIGAFSFYPGKNLGAYGEGGAVLTNDPDLYERMWLIHDHGSREKYIHQVIGHNYRLEGIQAAVLNVKLGHIEEWTRKRKANAGLYTALLGGVAEVQVPAEMPRAKHVYHLYVIQAKDRERLQSFLKDKGVQTGLHYPIPLHLQKAFEYLGHKQGDFPAAEKTAAEILSLPMFPELTEEQIRFVVDRIKEFYAQDR